MVDIGGIIKTSYNHYIKANIGPNDRPLADMDNDDIDGDGNFDEKLTYSEGVSYLLLRAVEMNDQTTFDKAWAWAQKNLQRKNIHQVYNPDAHQWQAFGKNDHLFAWRWVPDCGGRAGGVMSTKQDFDPASDADQDIAAALLKAHTRWGSAGQVNYQKEGQAILNDIWNKETKVIAGKRVLIAGDTQNLTVDPFTGKPTFGVNPSYLRPSYYGKLFADNDRAHDWRSMVAPAYEIIEKAADATLHDELGQPVQGTKNLTPDWVALDSNFNIHDYGWKKGDHKSQKDYFAGGDAFRILYWMTVRLKENPGDTTAKRFFNEHTGTAADFGPFSFLKSELTANGTIFSSYNIDGEIHWPSETPQALAAYLVYFWAAGDIDSANKIMGRLQNRYDNQGFWQASEEDNYYAQNWVWFALNLINQEPTGWVKPVTGGQETTLPREFNRFDETPRFLIARNKAQIADMTREMSQPDNQGFLTNYSRARVLRDEDDIKAFSASHTMFDLLFVRFLKRRELGDPKHMEDINQAIKSFSGAGDVFQKSQMAFILAAEPDKYLKEINILGFGKNLPAGLPKKGIRYRLYQEIHNYYKKVPAQYTIRNLPDPELEGEMLLQIAINAPNRNETKKNLDLALKKFDAVLNNRVSDDDKIGRGKTFAQMSRVQHPYEARRRLRFARGLTQLQKAQILLFQSSEEDSPKKALEKITAAYNLLKKATRVAEVTDLFFVQIKQMAAECSLRTSFILKDLNQRNTVLEINGRTGHSHLELLKVTAAFLADNTTWINGYNQTVVTNPASRPLWVRQMEAFNYIWQAKEEMFRAGETRVGLAKDYSLKQLVMLQTAENNLRAIIGQSDLLEPETIADAKRTLAENLTRQAFIAIEFNAAQDKKIAQGKETINVKGYISLLGTPDSPSEAGKLLAEVIKLTPTEKIKEVQVEARVWLAKIALAQADKELNRQKKEEILKNAMGQLTTSQGTAAFGLAETGRPLLRGTSLSSALQTVGDIFTAQKNLGDAKIFYRLALGEKNDLSADELSRFPFLKDLFTPPQGKPQSPLAELLEYEDVKKMFSRNFFALSSLGDILNWQGNYADATSVYNRVPADAVPYAKAQLGLIEAEMRTNENYTPQQVDRLEKRVKDIFASEPPASSLVLRALQSLFEAYRTNEDWQEKILFAGNALLGFDNSAEIDGNKDKLAKIFEPLAQNMKNGYDLEDKVKAEIYLASAEILLWRQRYEDALSFLDLENNDKIKDQTKSIRSLLENKPDLRIRHKLIEAETRMRNSRAAGPFLDFVKAENPLQAALGEKDPDLAVRIIGDKIEARMLEKSWKEAIDAATPENWGVSKGQINAMFESRTLGYQKAMFELDFKLVEALIGAKDFNQAVKEIIRKEDTAKAGDELGIISKTEEMKVKYPHLSSLADRFLAQANIYLGKVYSYRWSEQDFEKSNGSYKNSLNLVKNDLSKAGRLLLAETYLGLGEIHRFGQSMTNGLYDYETSKNNYRLALQILAGSIQPSSLGAGKDEIWRVLEDAKYIDDNGIIQPLFERRDRPDLPLNTSERNRVIALLQQSRKVPQKSIKRRELITDVYHGFSLLEQAETHPVPSYQYLLNARHYMGQLLVPPDETLAAIPRTSNTILTPNLTASYEHFGFGVGSNGYGSSGTENRFSVIGRLPLYREQFIFSFTNNTDTRKDRFGESRINASRIGLYYRPEWLDKLVTVGIDAKIPGMNRELFQTARSLPVNFQNPNMIFSGSVATKWLTAFAAYNWNWENPLLTSHYEKLMWNLASHHISWLQAQVGLEGGQYNFTVLGTPRERANIGLVVNWDYDPAEVKPLGEGAELRHGTFKVGGTLGIGLWQREFIPGATCGEKAHNPGLTEAQTVNRSIFNMFNSSSSCSTAKDPYYNKYSTKGPAWGSIPLYLMGRVEYNAGRIGVVQLYGGLNYQQTPEFTYQDWRAGVNFNLVQFLGL
ncbi:MAG: glycosyl hydrolase family 8 [Candidatus Margulisbacteria bacterium]|nr:glycosyl hydrolase family 8 [Candidatus Margulisiibacteriota bacterium]